MFFILFSVLALEASLGGVAGGGLGAESTFDRNNLGQVVATFNYCQIIKIHSLRQINNLMGQVFLLIKL